MGKSDKIRRYRRKDYNAVVDFPVEIIGRDGVVRRYSFEESIRLYQKRIASADLRYTDREIIQAEKNHCLHRIEQLRRSFFARYGWPAVEVVDEDGRPGLLAAEVAAFLRRCLAPIDPNPENFTFSKLDGSGDYRVFFVQPPEAEPFTDSLVSGHFLLYVFEFDTRGGCPSRDAFFDMIKVLDGVHVSAHSSVEALIAFFHTHDCGLILTGSGSAVEVLHDIELSEMEALSWAPTPEAPDPVERGMRLLGQGQMEAALVAFTEAYTQQNFRRVGYLGAAVVADQLGNDAEAETATVMGMQYFPADPAMAFHRALNRMRGGHYRQALVRLDAIEEWPNGRGAVGMLRALCLLADGQTLKGQQELRRLRGCDFRLDPHLERGVRWIRAQIWARDVLVCIAACTAMAGLIGVVNGALWQGIWAGLGLLGVRLVMRSWKRQLVSQISGPLDGRMRLSSSAVLMDSDSKSVLQ